MAAGPGWDPTVLALVGLFASLGVAVTRPARIREAWVAVPFALAVLAVHGVSPTAATREVRDLLPVVLFLVAVLVLARVCAAEGLFEAIGELARRSSRSDPHRLLLIVVAVAALTTTILSLDTTVVLLTPVVVATVRRAGLTAAPFLLVTVHLANSASLLLPVSNLTNLLALQHTGLDFVTFAARLALPWLCAVTVEYVAVRWTHRRDLVAAEPRVRPDTTAAVGATDGPGTPIPRFALVVVLATLVGFAVTGPLGVAPVWVAAAGALVLAVPALTGRRVGARELATAAGSTSRSSSWRSAWSCSPWPAARSAVVWPRSCRPGRPGRTCSSSRCSRPWSRTSSTTCRRRCCCSACCPPPAPPSRCSPSSSG